MGLAIAQVNLDALGELMGLKGKMDIQGVLPAGWNDLSRRVAYLLLESPAVPPTQHGMAFPVVTLVYETRAGGPQFKGFEFTEPRERKFPQGLMQPPNGPPDDDDDDDDDTSFVPVEPPEPQ